MPGKQRKRRWQRLEFLQDSILKLFMNCEKRLNAA